MKKVSEMLMWLGLLYFFGVFVYYFFFAGASTLYNISAIISVMIGLLLHASPGLILIILGLVLWYKEKSRLQVLNNTKNNFQNTFKVTK